MLWMRILINTKDELINYLEEWLQKPKNNSTFMNIEGGEGGFINIGGNTKIIGFGTFLKAKETKNLKVEVNDKAEIIAPIDTKSNLEPLIELLLLELKTPSKTSNLKSIVDKLNELIPIFPSISNVIISLQNLGLIN